MKNFTTSVTLFLILTAFFTLKAFSQTVYVQETGKKYHMKNCSVAGTGKKGMTIAEAKKASYTSCKVCKPDEVPAAEKPKSAEKPKDVEKPKVAEPKKATNPPAKPKN